MTIETRVGQSKDKGSFEGDDEQISIFMVYSA